MKKLYLTIAIIIASSMTYVEAKHTNKSSTITNKTNEIIWVHIKAKHVNKSGNLRHNQADVQIKPTENFIFEYKADNPCNEGLEVLNVYNYDPKQVTPNNQINNSFKSIFNTCNRSNMNPQFSYFKGPHNQECREIININKSADNNFYINA